MNLSNIAIVFLLATSSAFADATFTSSVGLDFSSGKYGQSGRTETLVMPLGLKYETEDWTFRASIPYVWTHGPAGVVGYGPDQVTVTPGKPGTRSVEGLGDIVLGAGWNALQRGPWLLELVGKVKLATADSQQGLGTGSNDFSFQSDLYRSFGSHTLLATLGYKRTGDPDGMRLLDPFYASLGWTSRLSASSTLGASADYRQKIQDSGAPLRELTCFAIHKLDQHWKLQAYLVKGFSRSSPDLGGGLFLFYAY